MKRAPVIRCAMRSSSKDYVGAASPAFFRRRAETMGGARTTVRPTTSNAAQIGRVTNTAQIALD